MRSPCQTEVFKVLTFRLYRAWRDAGFNYVEFAAVVKMGVYVVRAFVPLRDLLAGNRELVRRLEDVGKNPNADDDAGYLRKEHQNAAQTDV